MGMVIVEGEGAVLRLNLGRPIVTNGDLAMRLFPNYFGQYVFNICSFRACNIGLDCKICVDHFVMIKTNY